MKILYVVHSNATGGSNQALFKILDYMRQLHEVRVLCPKPANDKAIVVDYCKENNIVCYADVFYDALVYGTDKNVIRRFIRTCGRIYRHFRARKVFKTIIRQYNPDIVHSNNGIIDIALDACIKYRIPHVWHLREYQDLDFKMSIIPSKRYWMKKIHKKGNYNIAITKGIFDYFKLRPCDKQIYDGVLKSKKVILPSIKNDNKYFLFVAGCIHTEGKGFLDALHAFAIFHLKHHDYRLIAIGAIGENDYKKQCDKFISQLQLSQCVECLGVKNNVDEFMASATAILVPSNFEGFGFITVEAMSNGCIVIGRNTAGTKEQFDNGANHYGSEIGYRFEDVDGMASCMEQLVSEDTEDMRKRAKEYVYNTYTVSKSCELLDKYYHDIKDGKESFIC